MNDYKVIYMYDNMPHEADVSAFSISDAQDRVYEIATRVKTFEILKIEKR